jgi:hypothetical protein
VIKKLIPAILVILILVNICEAAIFWKTRAAAGLYTLDTVVPTLSGYLLDDTVAYPKPGRCALLRVSSDGCQFCRLDQPLYSRLLTAVEAHHCNAAIIAPKQGQRAAIGNTGGAMELQFIDMRLGQVLKPVMTPQTLLVDDNGQLEWYRAGMMDERALSAALKIVSGFR